MWECISSNNLIEDQLPLCAPSWSYAVSSGLTAMTGNETSQGYIWWFYSISHPCIILPDEVVHVPRPPEKEALDEIVAEQEGKHEHLDLVGILGSIKDHVYSVMVSGVVAQGIDEWSHLEAILAEVYGGQVYRRRHGGRGGGV